MPRIESPRASDRDTTLDNLDPHSGSLLGRTVTKSLRSLNYIVLISSIMHVLCLLLSSEWAYYFYRNAFSMAGWNYFLSLLYLAWVWNKPPLIGRFPLFHILLAIKTVYVDAGEHKSPHSCFISEPELSLRLLHGRTGPNAVFRHP